MDEDDDLYSDLFPSSSQPNSAESEEVKQLKEEIEKLKSQLKDTENKLHDKQKENDRLKVNISKLYYTAKQEIEKLKAPPVIDTDKKRKR